MLVHLNDWHGQLEPSRDAAGRDRAGIAQLATYVRQEREAAPGRVLLLHAGDELSRGGPLTAWFGGALDFEILRQLGCAAFTPGNGEWYFATGRLQHLANTGGVPWLHANVLRGDGRPVFEPTLRLTVAGRRIGVLGLGFARMEHPAVRGLRWRDPVETAREWVPRLRPEVDLLIVLSHLGLPADRALATAVSGIDLIVGGHTHTLLATPQVVSHNDGQTVIAQAGEHGDVGRLELDQAAGRWAIRGGAAALDPALPPDPAITALLAPRQAELAAPLAVCRQAVPHPATGHSPLAHLVAEALRWAAQTPLALIDRGVVNGGLAAGPVTRRRIAELHPWGNAVLRVRATAGQVRSALAQPEVVAAGGRLGTTAAGEGCLLLDGRAVADETPLELAIGDFCCGNSPTLRDLPATATGLTVDHAFADYLQRPGVLR
ncbi:MAG: bifunctional metallophosphatase/5'-nucleotidase [Fimbriimonadaceae bacterium]|nr:bifunctional metallophosphatase/5'-nucleotidase [Fimbriimonadaceae bacterium]